MKRTPWLSTSLLLGLAAVAAVSLAYLIASGRWPFAVGMVLLVPAILMFIKYPFAFFILWLLAAPFLQATTTVQTRQMYWILYRALPPLALFGTILVNRLRPGNRLRFRLGIDGLVMFIFLGWTLLNIFWFHPTGNLSYLYSLYDKVFVPFCLYWWIRVMAPSERDLQRLIPGAFVLVIFEVVVGILSWLHPAIIPREWVGYASNRTIGTLVFVHAYSLTLVFFSLLLFQAAMHRKSTAARLALLCAVGIGMAGVFLSFSRGAWLGGLAAGVGLLCLYPKPMLRLTLVVLIIMAVLGSTVLYKQMAYAEERLNSEKTAMARLVVWDAGLQMIRLKPFWGWGYGDYRQYAGQFQERVANLVSTEMEASHNTFISFSAELGVPGLLLYLFPALWWLALTVKRRQLLPQTGFWSRKLLIMFWLMILAHSVTSFFSDIRTSVYGLSLWCVTLGWIANIVDPHRADDIQTSWQPQPGWPLHARYRS